ncbi:hypothetical protein AB0H00_04700 [Nocardia sp. NPDC023852]|uniref:hypothetical protein n=1 Tax=Nocardia sp. NPDC023852 TaxID=3154697 RepID=UPI0033C7BE2D
MSTAISAISDITTSIGAAGAEFDRRGAAAAAVELGYETGPRVWRGGARARAMVPAHRSAVDRCPRGARPGGTAVLYDRAARTSALRRARGRHPMERVERAQVGFAVLAVTALLTALAVAGLIVLAHVRAGDWGGGSVGSVPAVVDGQGGAGAPPPR